MQPERLLDREHLAPRIRTLIGCATAIWHADWPRLERWAELARQLGQPRADIEETLLQCVLFCGFPRVITAFEHAARAWPSERPPQGGALPPERQRAAGEELFATIYGKNQTAVRAMLASYHGELHDFVFEAAYGRILTRPHLPPQTRELIAVGVLVAQRQKRQFAGHARGAMHLGASLEELREVLVTALADDGADTDAAIAPWLARIH
ncbi:MAG TPA: carboxymuconolactone decarboxylase family protein [bacterium]|nr:carboxymuconolactone decarboxylase family protein [bacterium]